MKQQTDDMAPNDDIEHPLVRRIAKDLDNRRDMGLGRLDKETQLEILTNWEQWAREHEQELRRKIAAALHAWANESRDKDLLEMAAVEIENGDLG
jgi:hypothetical protein